MANKTNKWSKKRKRNSPKCKVSSCFYEQNERNICEKQPFEIPTLIKCLYSSRRYNERVCVCARALCIFVSALGGWVADIDAMELRENEVSCCLSAHSAPFSLPLLTAAVALHANDKIRFSRFLSLPRRPHSD